MRAILVMIIIVEPSIYLIIIATYSFIIKKFLFLKRFQIATTIYLLAIYRPLYLKSCSNEESQIPSSEDNIFAKLSESDFYLYFRKLQSFNPNYDNYPPCHNL